MEQELQVEATLVREGESGPMLLWSVQIFDSSSGLLTASVPTGPVPPQKGARAADLYVMAVFDITQEVIHSSWFPH